MANRCPNHAESALCWPCSTNFAYTYEVSEAFQRPEEFSEAVVVYGTTLCGYCAMAKGFLSKQEIPYAWVDVGGDSQAREWLREASGQRTVPQIFVHQRSVGGYSDLRALHQRGELEALLKG